MAEAIITLLDSLASILLKQGRIKHSEDVQQQVIEGRKKIYGPDSIHTIRGMVNLVAVLCSSKKCTEAEMWAHKAIKGSEKSHGKMHIETLLAHRSLARALECQGR